MDNSPKSGMWPGPAQTASFSAEALREMRQILHALPTAICILDRHMTILVANARFAALLACRPEQLHGARVGDFAPASLTTAISLALQVMTSGGLSPELEIDLGDRVQLATFGAVTGGAVNAVGASGTAPQAFCVTLSDVTRVVAAGREIETSNDTLRKSLREVTQVARTDALTGLPNRHAFELVLSRVLRASRETQTGMGLALIDIDHFKRYNDTYGHVLGDESLAAVAEALASTLNGTLAMPGSSIARFGGEEFVVVFPVADFRAIGTAIADLGRAVAELRIEHAGSPHQQLTVSIGGFVLRQIDPDASDEAIRHLLLQRADKILYAAKEAGRDTPLLADSEGQVRVCRERSNDAPGFVPDDRQPAQAGPKAGTQAGAQPRGPTPSPAARPYAGREAGHAAGPAGTLPSQEDGACAQLEAEIAVFKEIVAEQQVELRALRRERRLVG